MAGLKITEQVAEPAPVVPRRFVVVATRTGGQGKTLIAHLLSAFMRGIDPGFVVMCADSLEVRGSARVSKLGKIVSGVIEHGAGPSASELQADPALAYSFWDGLAVPLMDGGTSGVVLDVGANVVDQIIDWGVVANLSEVLDGSVAIDFVVPVVASTKSISDATSLISKVVASKRLPVNRIFLVLNFWQGSFEGFEGDSEFKKLMKLVNGNGGRTVGLPMCYSRILAECERRDLFVSDILDKGYQKIGMDFGWSLILASRERSLFLDWYEKVSAGFKSVGLLDLTVEFDLKSVRNDARLVLT